MSTEAQKLAKRKYNQSEKGKANRRRWRMENKECDYKCSYRYQSSDKGKAKRNCLQRKVNRDIKIKVLTHYSYGLLACVQCDEKRIDCLSVDHINNNGHEHRKTTGNGQRFYRWLIKNNLPLGYQTLCMNCQWIKKAQSIKHKFE